MGTPVPHDLPHVGSFPISEEEAKLSRMRLKAKVLNVTSGALLSVVSAPTVYYGADSSCNGMLVRTIFLWSFIFGLLLIAAELELHIVTTHVHGLQVRPCVAHDFCRLCYARCWAIRNTDFLRSAWRS